MIMSKNGNDSLGNKMNQEYADFIKPATGEHIQSLLNIDNQSLDHI